MADTRHPSDYRIRAAEPADAPELVDEVIAPHQRDPDGYDPALDRPGVHAYVAVLDGDLVGVTALDARPARTVSERCAVVAGPVHDWLGIDPAARVGLCRTAYVRPGHTGNGIGSALLAVVTAVARLNDLPVLVAEAWVHDGPDTPDQLLESSGFERTPTPPGATDAPFVRDDDACVKCAGPCRCEVRLYHRWL